VRIRYLFFGEPDDWELKLAFRMLFMLFGPMVVLLLAWPVFTTLVAPNRASQHSRHGPLVETLVVMLLVVGLYAVGLGIGGWIGSVVDRKASTDSRRIACYATDILGLLVGLGGIVWSLYHYSRGDRLSIFYLHNSLIFLAFTIFMLAPVRKSILQLLDRSFHSSLK